MSQGHAFLSPSAADRWWNCPGSVVLSEGFEQKSSPYAEEGTKAHALAEALLSGVTPLPPHNEEMLEHVQVYVDYVDELLRLDPRAVLMTEKRVHVTDDVHGTADAIVWLPATKTLHVVDLKYGAGVMVSTSNNLQLQIYGLAALLTMKYPALKVVVTIVQPRIVNSEDGCIRSKEYSSADLIDFWADLSDAETRVKEAIAASDVAPYLNPTEKGCRWCLAAPVCPKLKDLAQNLAKQAFAPGLPYDPEELDRTLSFLPILEGWIASTREFAYGEAKAGRSIPNWKLVEKRATRKWVDEDIAAGTLQALHIECYDAPKLKSPAAIEKMIPKNQRDILTSLVVKESSGTTLVPASDAREAVTSDARSAFSDEQ